MEIDYKKVGFQIHNERGIKKMNEQIKSVLEELDKLTKTDLLDIIENFIESGILECEDFDFLIDNGELSTEQIEVIHKLKNKEILSDEDKQLINSAIEKKAKTKTKSLAKSKDKFLSFLAEFKIDYWFNIAWINYPKKVGKELGKKAFVKLVSDCKFGELDTNCRYVISRIKKYTEYCEDNGTEQQFILQFSTFCNSKKYL